MSIIIETYVDYAFNHPNQADIWKAGHNGIARYFHDVDPAVAADRGKRLTRAEADAAIAAGKKVFVFYENGTEDAAKGFAKGVENAKKALAYRDKIGADKRMAIVFTSDHGYKWADVKDYFAGARSVLAEITGVYGGEDVARGAVAEGYAVVIQAYAWSGGDGRTNESARKVPGISAFQNLKPNKPVASGSIDELEIYIPIPSWGDKAPVPAPKPAPPTVSLGKVVSAAKADPRRPDGGKTPGSEASVGLVERALVRAGLLAVKFQDGSYGTKTVQAYQRWQKQLGMTGKDADGIPGRTSLIKLGERYGFQVIA